MEWINIEGYDYRISSDGIVARNGLYIKPYLSSGYWKVDLYRDAKRRKVFIHQLLGETFLKASHFVGAVINHKDGNRLNNNLSNLEWVTTGQNNLHKYRVLGWKCIRPSGALSPHAKRIVGIARDGSTVKEYGSIAEAQHDFGSGIEKNLSGKRKSAYGYIWKYQ